MKCFLFLSCLLLSTLTWCQQKAKTSQSIYLENVDWTKAKEVLTPDAIVVIPLGAQAKEHGPHLPLSADFLQANDAAKRVASQRKVIIAPPVNYGYYPAFIKYAGSTCLSFSTSVEMVVQVVRSLANYGPRRFYIINAGISTTPTLEVAAKALAVSGILLAYSDYNRPAFANAFEPIATQAYGGHADELETSSVLAIRPDLVDMTKAVDDSSIKGKRGVITPVELAGGNLNKSGINGYATLATRQKGERAMTAFAQVLVQEIDSVATCALPVAINNPSEFSVYKGTYTSTDGVKLDISQQDNHLYFVLNGRDQRNFFPLYKEAADYFTSIPLDVLFVKDESGKVVKAWCQNAGQHFWLTKSK